jgi:hypothetical protein
LVTGYEQQVFSNRIAVINFYWGLMPLFLCTKQYKEKAMSYNFLINANQIINNNLDHKVINTAYSLSQHIYENRKYKIKNSIKFNHFLTPADVAVPRKLLEPGVIYRVEWIPSRKRVGEEICGLPKGKFVEFVSTSSIPMGDWDFPEDTHHPTSITIKNVGDVYKRLIAYTKQHNSLWKVYLTPGGVRAFDISRNINSKEFKKDFKSLNIDPCYARLAMNQPRPDVYSKIPKYNLLYPKQSWAFRLSGKPNRKNDFVALYLGTVGNGKALSYNSRIVKEYHDKPIQKYCRQNNIDLDFAKELATKHLDSIPLQFRSSIQKQIES